MNPAPQRKIVLSSSLLQMKGNEKILLLVRFHLEFIAFGLSKRSAFEKIQSFGYTQQQRALDYQVALFKATGSISARTHQAGPKCKLSDEQLDNLFG